VTEDEAATLDVDAADLENVMDRLARLSRRYDVMITLSISPYAPTDAAGSDGDDREDDDGDTAE
jgi:hypothetical protein